MNWPPDVHPIRGWLSWSHLLFDEEGVVVIDTGFPGDAGRIRRGIERRGFTLRDVRAILLTHGHVDHAGSAAWLRAATGAPVCAHPADQPHLDGRHPYRGLARTCGVLEAVARAATRYQPVTIDVPIADDAVLPWWGGLRVVHLPGHTVGHCGFYSAKHDVLFSGDLWVRFLMRTQVSPRIFTDAPELVLPSLRKARAIGARWVIPGHYGVPNATRLKARFETLCHDLEQRGQTPVI